MGVADGGGRLRLAGEAPTGESIGRPLRRQQLDRDEPVERRVERPEDDAHPPLPEPVDQLVVSQSPEVLRVRGRIEPLQGEGVVGRGDVAQRRRDVLDPLAILEEVAQLVVELGMAGQPGPTIRHHAGIELLEVGRDHMIQPVFPITRRFAAPAHGSLLLQPLVEVSQPAAQEPGD